MLASPRRSATIVALDELKRREDLESLRKYLIEENCFPALKDPRAAVITMEELKKLARVWKLNERRNFWKEHSDRNDMVAALLAHVEQNMNYSTKKIKLDGSSEFLAVPPTDLKPSMTGRQAYFGVQLKNYCGKKYFNRDGNERELILGSRFSDFPTPEKQVDRMIDTWRDEDFDLRDGGQEAANTGANNYNYSGGSQSSATRKSKLGGTAGIKNKAKIVKHRNLSTHIMNYSANPELNKTTMTLKSIQTFINVADSDDPVTVSNCMIALSNVASSDHVRALLFEVNALHKFTNMLHNIRGKAALRAAALLFYYFSCDKDTEDRVYNSCSSFLQANGASKEGDTRMLSLYTLNNLMPCIDRARVADITMRIIHANFEHSLSGGDKTQMATFLLIMQNMCCFSNVHSTLLGLNVLELIAQVASYSIAEKNTDLALGVLKIMQAFLQAPEQAAHLVTLEYIQILMTLLASDNEVVLLQSVRVATTLSTLAPLRSLITLSKIVRTMARAVNDASLLTTKLAKEFAKFFVNVTLDETPQGMETLLEGDIHTALLRLLKDANATTAVKAVVVRAVQNLVSVSAVGVKLATAFFEHIVRFLCEASDIGAAMTLYNISCLPQCRTELVEAKIHLRLLDFLVQNKDQGMKSALLQILVQMSSSNVCVRDLLQQQLITKLEAQIRGVSNVEVWNDVSLLLLAVVAFAAKDLSEDEEVSIVRILQIICVPRVPDKVLENCSNVLKYVSVRFAPFEHLSPVVRAILSLAGSEGDDVTENLSNVLYNMTCSAANIAHMLKDSEYVDIMIHIMRNGNLEVQENIAQCMRNFSANPRCVEILLKTDILSDLIVIALLRTSSEEIKVVCSEAFYNMLCHGGTRLRLLQGDLWWAVMRLCRTDSNQVRTTCARALFDLSTEAVNCAPLRTHHILSFVRDIIHTGNEEFLQVCMRSVHNLVRQYGLVEPAAHRGVSAPPTATATAGVVSHEIIAMIRIATEMLSRMKKLDYIRDTILLLLYCAHPDHMCDGAAQEFAHLYLVEVLDNTKTLWGPDAQCRLFVSRLMWELSKSDVFTKATLLSDLDPVMRACYHQDPPFEICDNLCAQFLQHVLKSRVEPAQFIHLPVWKQILQEGLSADSVVMASVASNINSASFKKVPGTPDQLVALTRNLAISRSASRDRSVASIDLRDAVDPVAERAFSTKSAVLSLFAYSVREMIIDTPELITKALVQGFMQNDLLDHAPSRVNLLVAISALSGVSTFTSYLLDCKVLQLLHRHLMNGVGTARYAQTQEFCSSFLRNMSLHGALVPRYVSSSDGMLCELIRELLEVPNPAVHLDLAVFFFNSANHLVKSEQSLNPKFVLDMLGRISNIETDSDSEVTGINKFTISMVLNKYSFGSGVEPNYVQDMLTYMQHPSSQQTPAYIETATYTCAVDLNVTLLPDSYRTKLSPDVQLKTFPPEENLWSPTVTTEPKRHENIILKFTHPSPVVHSRLELLEGTASSAVVFGKIFREFGALKESVGATDNNAIAEGEEEEQDEDDEGGLEEPSQGVLNGMEQILEESSVSSNASSPRRENMSPAPGSAGNGEPYSPTPASLAPGLATVHSLGASFDMPGLSRDNSGLRGVESVNTDAAVNGDR